MTNKKARRRRLTEDFNHYMVEIRQCQDRINANLMRCEQLMGIIQDIDEVDQAIIDDAINGRR